MGKFTDSYMCCFRRSYIFLNTYTIPIFSYTHGSLVPNIISIII